MNALMKFLGEDDSDNGFVVCHNESEVKKICLVLETSLSLLQRKILNS